MPATADSDMTLTASELVSSIDSCSKKSQTVGSLPYEVSCADEQQNSISQSLSFSELNATTRRSSNGQKSSEMSDFSVSHLTSGSQRDNKKSDCEAKRNSVKKSVDLSSFDANNISDATSVRNSKTSKSSDQLPILPDLQCVNATFNNGNSTSLKTSMDLDVGSRNCSLDCNKKTSSLEAVTDFNRKLLGSNSEKEFMEATYKDSDVSFGALPNYLLENRKSSQSSSAVKASREPKSSSVSLNLPSNLGDASQLGCVERDFVVTSTGKMSLEENGNSYSGLVRSNLTSSSTKCQADSVSEVKQLSSLMENRITSGRTEKEIGNSRQQSFEHSLNNSSNETSHSESSAEQPTVLNITEIAQRISLSSESGNNEDLAKYIALMSHSQSTGKNPSQPKVHREVDSVSDKVETKSAGKIEAVGINNDNKNLSQLKKNVGNKDIISEKAGSINTSQAGLGSNNLRANVPNNESAKPSCNGPIKESSVIVNSFEQPANLTQSALNRLLSDDRFNFRSPRQSLVFSHSKRHDFEQSFLTNSFVPSEISFASSSVDQRQKHLDKSVSKKQVLLLPAPVNHGDSVDISADLGQTVKKGSAVTKPALEQKTTSDQRADDKPESTDAVGCKRNSTCALARSHSYQQAVASSENHGVRKSRIVESALNGHSSSVLQHQVASGTVKDCSSSVWQHPLVGGSIGKKDESVFSDRSLSDISMTIVPSQEMNKDVAFIPLALSDTTSFVTSMSGPGGMPNRLSSGLLNGSNSETSRLVPVTENAAAMQLSQYPLVSGDPSQRISADVSLMTSRLSLPGLDNSLAIDLFTQSTPMVKTSLMPDVCNTANYNSRKNSFVSGAVTIDLGAFPVVYGRSAQIRKYTLINTH